jgi:hypothetical protein
MRRHRPTGGARRHHEYAIPPVVDHRCRWARRERRSGVAVSDSPPSPADVGHPARRARGRSGTGAGVDRTARTTGVDHGPGRNRVTTSHAIAPTTSKNASTLAKSPTSLATSTGGDTFGESIVVRRTWPSAKRGGRTRSLSRGMSDGSTPVPNGSIALLHKTGNRSVDHGRVVRICQRHPSPRRISWSNGK